MSYSSGFGSQPSNNLWVGNNYSTGAYRGENGNYNMMQQSQPQPQAPQRMNNIFQVMGPESAQAFQIGPDSQVVLLDSNRPVLYIKKSDSSGYSETKAYQYNEIPLFAQENNMQDLTEFVTKTEFNDFKTMIEDLVMKHE